VKEPTDEELEAFAKEGTIPYEKVRFLRADSPTDMREMARQKDLASLRGCFEAGRSSRDAEVSALELRASTSERRERERAGELEAARLVCEQASRYVANFGTTSPLHEALAAYYRASAKAERQAQPPKCVESRPSAPEPKQCETTEAPKCGWCDGRGVCDLMTCTRCKGSGLAPAPCSGCEGDYVVVGCPMHAPIDAPGEKVT